MDKENCSNLVCGLGFVVLRAAHLEGEIDELLYYLSPIKPFSEKDQRKPTSKKYIGLDILIP